MGVVYEVSGRVIAPLIGGYDTLPVNKLIGSNEPLRPTEFKGKWRWWMRTAIVSALGSKCDYTIAEEFVNGILGSTSQPSKYQLILEPGECYGGRIILTGKSRIPRLRQRFFRIKEELYIPTYCNFRLTIRRTNDVDPRAEDLALRTLTLFLLLDGVGSASNRGFGSIAPQQISHFEPAARLLGELRRARYADEIRNAVLNFIETTKTVASAYVGKRESDGSLPRVPSLGNIRFDAVDKSGLGIPMILLTVGRATLKSHLMRSCGRVCPPLTRSNGTFDYHTWILGLPRGRMDKGGRTVHGYSFEDADRRQSSIKLKIMELGRRWVFVTGMPSLDWPIDSLKHKKAYGKPISIKNAFPGLSDEEIIARVFEWAWNCVRRCLR